MSSRKIVSSRPKGSDAAKRAGKAGARASSASGAKGRRDGQASGAKVPLITARPIEAKSSSSDVLARAEADIATAVESLNKQMSAAMATLTELAVAQRGRGEAVVRTAPLDRATATFQRLIAEVVDEKLSEMLPPVISLRNELSQRTAAHGSSDGSEAEFYERSVSMLDQVLASADVRRYEARVGEAFDPVIHLAVGEMNRHDLGEGAVAESLMPGFRSSRGKVIVPARVKVNRR